MKYQQAKCMTKNFKVNVQNPYSSNSDKNDDIYFCNKRKVYYYVIIGECD